MEMGSSSLAVSGGSDSSDPLDGLKFGKKIYFEDVGIGVSGKSSGGSSAVSVSERSTLVSRSPELPKKGRGAVHGGQPPRCQVEGCKLDLSSAKAYYSRHKVCGMHSKFPKVIVAGLEQRFCQQCSRFHLLSEFDQGKRSCRRRLAGHNERRRKPPPGSLLSSRFGLLSSLHENRSKDGSFLMNFTMYPGLPERVVWPTNTGAGNRASDNKSVARGKFLPHPWQGSSENPPVNVFSHGSFPYLHSSAGERFLPHPGIPPDECFEGVSESSCALSLLSTRPWGTRNHGGPPMFQSAAPHGAVAHNFTSNAWDFKGNEASSSLPEMPPDLGLGQVSQPINNQFSSELQLAQQGGRQYMELGHSSQYHSSTTQMHWSP